MVVVESARSYWAQIGNGTMTTMTPTDLQRLRDDVQRAYDALIHERFGSLTARQHQRLGEIVVAVEKVSLAIDEYRNLVDIPDPLRTSDPRYRLMYAARTPMEMILQCAYFLHINHMRKQEVLNNEQIEAVWLIERSGRRLVLEIEHLWAAMRTEVKQQL